MSTSYNIRVDMTREGEFTFFITRTSKIESDITVEEPFPGNWSHFHFESREAAIALAKERIEKDKQSCQLS